MSALTPTKHSCLALNGENGWSVILYEEGDNLQANKIQTQRLVYTPSATKDVVKLMQLVQTRKEEVIQLLRQLLIEHADLQKCLQECRRFCYVTMQNTLSLGPSEFCYT